MSSSTTAATSATATATAVKAPAQPTLRPVSSRGASTSAKKPIQFRSETALAVATLGMVGVMVLPLPAFLLDVLLSVSVSLSLIVFLFSLHIERPLEFSAFPSILLLSTLMRLGLNIASTRIILLRGNEGPSAAGNVIEAFAQFVVGGNIVVGIIVFIILVVINFVVVTKGAGRIAEVSARFTLDAMPGKQMAIDADLAAGLINERDARDRRQRVEQEADFYGSMDGASKFVRGDAIAGVLITVVNIVGGLIVGMLQHDMSAVDAGASYTNLTIGDGLVSQIPSLLTSIAAGLVTTRAAAGGSLGQTVHHQLFGTRKTLQLAAMVMGAMALVPGMPHLAFLALAGGLYFASLRVPEKAEGESEEDAVETLSPTEQERQEVESALPMELLELEVGFELVPLVDEARDGALLKRISGVRKQIASELGIIVPPIHVRDNLRLRPGGYRILLSGSPVGESELRVTRVLAMSSGTGPLAIPGEDVIEPAFALPARWISPADRDRAELNGYTVVDPATVAATHLGELLNSHAHQILGRRELQELLDIHSPRLGKLVDETIPGVVSAGLLLRVLRGLLYERVSIRDFRTILEALAEHGETVKDAESLIELVRQRMSKQLTAKHLGDDGAVHALLLAPGVEDVFRRMQAGGTAGMVNPQELRELMREFDAAIQKTRASMPVVVTAADIRRAVAAFVDRNSPGIPVLSFRELEPRVELR
ncbi:MAG: flagellar biosynthesis protein FlhA, partial [Myxococcota bacterium]